MKGYTLNIHPFDRSTFLQMAFVAVQWCDDEVQCTLNCKKAQVEFS